jgi:hypothetical protein
MTAIFDVKIKAAPPSMPPVIERPRVDPEGDCYADRIARYELVLCSIEDLIAEIAVSNEQRDLLQTATIGLQHGIRPLP